MKEREEDDLQEEIKKRRTFCHYFPPGRGNKPSLSSCSTLGAKFVRLYCKKVKENRNFAKFDGHRETTWDFGHFICYSLDYDGKRVNILTPGRVTSEDTYRT